MPTKHIDKKLWEAIEQETVKAVTETKQPITAPELMRYAILKGIMTLRPEEIIMLRRMSQSTLERALQEDKFPTPRPDQHPDQSQK